jgi:hypothetical protein
MNNPIEDNNKKKNQNFVKVKLRFMYILDVTFFSKTINPIRNITNISGMPIKPILIKVNGVKKSITPKMSKYLFP